MKLVEMLEKNNKNILYYPKLRKITGSITATILLSYIIHLWKKNGGKFYKFIEPCSHPLYKEGDSWTEELELSSAQFRGALKKLESIGIVSHQRDGYHVTYYNLNEKVLMNAWEDIYENSIK